MEYHFTEKAANSTSILIFYFFPANRDEGGNLTVFIIPFRIKKKLLK